MTDWHAGGAVYVDYGGTPVFNDCVFRGNQAFAGGALTTNHGGRVTLNDCRFIGNQAIRGGRGLRHHHGKERLPVRGQRGGPIWGGAIWHNSFGLDYYESCTFDGNRRANRRAPFFTGSNYGGTRGDDRHHHFQLSGRGGDITSILPACPSPCPAPTSTATRAATGSNPSPRRWT